MENRSGLIVRGLATRATGRWAWVASPGDRWDEIDGKGKTFDDAYLKGSQ